MPSGAGMRGQMAQRGGLAQWDGGGAGDVLFCRDNAPPPVFPRVLGPNEIEVMHKRCIKCREYGENQLYKRRKYWYNNRYSLFWKQMIYGSFILAEFKIQKMEDR